MLKLPKTFQFSAKITFCSVVLAGVMVWASMWQWERYLYKLDLIETYDKNSEIPAFEFPTSGEELKDFESIIHRKVEISGEYDFEREMIVLNRANAVGPGYWLLTPMKLEGTDRHVIVSRGFIPFEDREPETWEKYRFSKKETLKATVQETVPPKTFLTPKSADVKNENEFKRKWLYPDIEEIAKQLPYPVITAVFLQRLGAPPSGTFPAESITVRVPPSTHYGYSIEWALLAAASLVVGFLLQAFPRKKRC